jgi:hypothetical protein
VLGLAATVGLSVGVWVTSAHAATLPPESIANCYGTVAPSPAPGEPNLLTYKFHCDQRITAYTVVVTRNRDYDTIDDFDVSPMAFLPDGTTPDTTVAWSCEGTTPSQSTNCNTGGGKTYMGAWSYAVGTVDLTAPYCKFRPPGARPGSRAQPQALVQLVVSDVSGAEDGPFRLYYTRSCPSLPNRVAAKKKRSKSHQASVRSHLASRRKGTK